MQTSFVPDLPGEYIVQLVVNDGTDDSAPDQAAITAEDNSMAAMIGPAGGEIQSKDGKLTLSIPAGALDQETEIRVTLALPIEDGKVYDLAPSGLEFIIPVTATLEIDAADLTGFIDENGDALDVEENLPNVLLFLMNEDNTIDPLLTSHVRRDEDSGIITVSTEIPHFTGLASIAGRGSYVFFSTLSAHYVGPKFKSKAALIFLGYSQTLRYQDMSIAFVLKSITATKIEFDVPLPLQIVSHNPLARNEFLNQRGQQSITRASFFCQDVGDSKVELTFSGIAIVEATFQPENVTLSYQVAVTMSTVRKAKCVAPFFGFNNQTFSQDDAEETALAALDPAGDVFLVADNTLQSASGLEVPDFVDLAGSLVSVVGDEGEEVLYASLSLRGMVPASLSSMDSFLSFDFLILDPSVGPTGPVLFDDVLWDIGLDGSGANMPLTPAAYRWNGEGFVDVPDLPMKYFRGDQWLAFTVPLDALGLTAEQARNSSFRVVTQIITTRSGSSQFFADRCDFGPITGTSDSVMC